MMRITILSALFVLTSLNLTAQSDYDSIQDYLNSGKSKGNLGDNHGAIEDFNKAIQLDPNDAKLYFYRGSGKGLLDDNHGTIQDFIVNP